MKLSNLFAATEIAASGLKAERTRLEVAANNIANANATRSSAGGPYRRQQVVFATDAGDSFSGTPELNGVNVVGIQTDQSPLPKVFNPGHPDADEQGFVLMPNVALPMEMVDMMTASRSYEANLKTLEVFRRITQRTLDMIGGRA